MLAVLSDTHETDSLSLPAHLRDVLDRADRLIHAGDFTTAAVLDNFAARAPLTAVFGNSDGLAVRERLPETTTVEWGGLTIAVAHGHRRAATGLSLLAREADADVLVRGHTHRPRVDRLGECLLLNPGSHADPRGNRPGYAVIEAAEEGPRIELRTPDGDCVASHVV